MKFTVNYKRLSILGKNRITSNSLECNTVCFVTRRDYSGKVLINVLYFVCTMYYHLFDSWCVIASKSHAILSQKTDALCV